MPSIATSSGFLVCSEGPAAKSWKVARSCTKRDAAVGAHEIVFMRAASVRYSSNSDRSALKPFVLMLATLLATTSICRSSVICRESPTRSVFSIGGSPLDRSEKPALPSLWSGSRRKPLGSPKPRGHASTSAKAVPSREMSCFQWVRLFFGARGGRQKGLVDHVCPADFSYLGANGKGSVNHYYPSVAAVEGACALAAFVSRCGGFVTQAGGNRVRSMNGSGRGNG